MDDEAVPLPEQAMSRCRSDVADATSQHLQAQIPASMVHAAE
jgi:hypothetical protein